MSIRISHKPSIDWMHPSWRDLVIEQLATDDKARRHFLSNCGLPGFLLALSVAGGALGSRTTPLLCTPHDWSALSSAVPRVLRSGAGATTQVLASLQAALTTPPEIHAISSPAGSFAQNVLAALREIWSGIEQRVIAGELERYYAISEILNPIAPGPNLQPIWVRSYAAAAKQVSAWKDQQWTDLHEVSDWLALTGVVIENEPRFVRQIAFPGQFLKFATDLLDRIRVRADRRFELDSPDYCAIEEGHLNALYTIAHQIGGTFRRLKTTATQVKRKAWDKAKRAEEHRHELEEEAREREAEDNEDYSYDDPPEEDPEERTILDEYVSIDRLFADL